jgi:bacterioferritin
LIKIIQFLNDILKSELAGMNQHLCHARMREHWGYFQLPVHNADQSAIAAGKLIERILALRDTPDLTGMERLIRVGRNVKEQLESDLALQAGKIPKLNAAIAHAANVQDKLSSELFKEILTHAEERVDCLEGQLHIISEIGLDGYLAS